MIFSENEIALCHNLMISLQSDTFCITFLKYILIILKRCDILYKDDKKGGCLYGKAFCTN